MLASKVISIVLCSVLLIISEARGAPKFSINFEGDTNEVPNHNQEAQWLASDEHVSSDQDNTEPHNIQIRSAFLPTIHILKTPSILIGKLKNHLGFGPKHPGCHEDNQYRFEEGPTPEFNFDRHNFDESERTHKHHGFHHDRTEFHKHGAEWNEFPHNDHFHNHQFEPFHPKHNPHHQDKKPTHQHSPSHVSTNDGKIFTNSVSSTTPQIDIRFGDP
ncbi:hypothetical protein WA026_006026 [Henosepilachna vigintioctopunctata]|uniref:Uncharacterized protein n=1 Tax=Henosepilachna vigintioctopunctata TaxID=420089 RepID=A0AAW1TIQ1_9CUCU